MSWSLFSTVSGIASGVTQLATKLAETVEETRKDFEKEQEAFIKQKALQEPRALHDDECVPPWEGLSQAETLREQIIELSDDKRNFLVDPPSESHFVFDLAVFLPVAKAIMNDDPRLEKKRFELVPKQITEYCFWRNYFYRVSLIKQSVQFADMERLEKEQAQKSNQTQEREASPAEGATPETAQGTDKGPADKQAYDSDFISDAIPEESSESWLKDMKAELDQLGVSVEEGESGEGEAGPDGEYDWEKELAKELETYDDTGVKSESEWDSTLA